jgi:hypothetical protein
MSGIMDPTVRGNEPGDHLLIGINRDRSFAEMFSELAGSFRVIMAAIPAGKSGRIDSWYGDTIIVRVEQGQCFFEGESNVEGLYSAEKFLERSEMRYD